MGTGRVRDYKEEYRQRYERAVEAGFTGYGQQRRLRALADGMLLHHGVYEAQDRRRATNLVARDLLALAMVEVTRDSHVKLETQAHLRERFRNTQFYPLMRKLYGLTSTTGGGIMVVGLR